MIRNANAKHENKKGPEVNPVLKSLWVVSTDSDRSQQSLYWRGFQLFKHTCGMNLVEAFSPVFFTHFLSFKDK